MIPVILSGGSGTRLWPVSRKQLPKQFCQLFEKPLQTMTLERSLPLGNPWVITSEHLKTLTEKNIKENGFQNVEVVYEPLSKNTAPALAVLCQLLLLQGKQDEVVAVFPSDHLIRDEKSFSEIINFAAELAQQNVVVTLGITPNAPETGYGYIQTKAEEHSANLKYKAYEVLKFHEKPSLELAAEFISQKGFSWNAGIFIFKVSHMIDLFKKYQPELWTQVSDLKMDRSNLKNIYENTKNISIDYAIMEKLSNQEIVCIPADFGWNDVGSWDAVANLAESEEIINVNSDGNFVFGDKTKKYSMIGVDDHILIDTPNALLLMKKGNSQDVRQVVETLTRQGSSSVMEHHFEYRPWGYFEVLKDTENFKSKVIRVNPHSQLSYQSHTQRAEHWTITQGFGEVVLNDEVIPVGVGSHIYIPTGAKHRMRNSSDKMLEFVEVQLGQYFGEDDIIRYQDDYSRSINPNQ